MVSLMNPGRQGLPAATRRGAGGSLYIIRIMMVMELFIFSSHPVSKKKYFSGSIKHERFYIIRHRFRAGRTISTRTIYYLFPFLFGYRLEVCTSSGSIWSWYNGKQLPGINLPLMEVCTSSGSWRPGWRLVCAVPGSMTRHKVRTINQDGNGQLMAAGFVPVQILCEYRRHLHLTVYYSGQKHRGR